MDNTKLLASLALFRELYNSKKNVYGILSEFLYNVIFQEAKFNFSLQDITDQLNEAFCFNIPKSVVKTTLKSMDYIDKGQEIYTVTDMERISQGHNISEQFESNVSNNDSIIKGLLAYIKEKNGADISDVEKNIIVDNFRSYLLDEHTNIKYSGMISSFIIKNEQDQVFIHRLNNVKEGVVLYSGLEYESQADELIGWKNDLTIFLDTEILFSCYGFNGELYKSIFNDFFNLVREINNKSLKKNKKKLILLKYFTEVQTEIDAFFYFAELIVSGREKLNPSKTAMKIIVDGCKTPADVLTKKVKFYSFITSRGIELFESQDFYREENFKFNIESKTLFNILKQDLKEEKIDGSVRLLNYINILRKGNNFDRFENINYILLTGTIDMLKIAWNEELKFSGSIPLATDIHFIINKFWFKLNKGFGSNETLKSFDIISKAQMVLSSQLKYTIAKNYEDLQNQRKNGNLSDNEAAASIAELRLQSKKPEDINEYNINDVLSSISEDSINNYIQEKELIRNNAKKIKEENELLRKENEKLKKENEDKEKQNSKFKEKEEKQNTKKSNRLKTVRILVVCVLGLSTIISVILLYIYFNQVISFIVGVLGLILTILSFLGFGYQISKKI